MSTLSKKQFTFENYLFCLQNQRAQRTPDFRIQTKCQQLSSNIIQKMHYPVSRTKDSFLIVESTMPLFLLIIAVDVMKMSATDVFIILM